jgi:hypothetical protein
VRFNEPSETRWPVAITPYRAPLRSFSLTAVTYKTGWPTTNWCGLREVIRIAASDFAIGGGHSVVLLSIPFWPCMARGMAI